MKTAEIDMTVNLADIIGQEHAKRAMEVASVGRSNILLVGGSGNGKGMLSEAYAGLLGENTEIIRVSVADTVKTITRKVEGCDKYNALIIAEELPELKRDVPLYIKEVSQTRNIPVAATMLPCPCGYLGDARHTCSCTPGQIAKYRKPLSGSLQDLFDIRIEVPAVSVRDICNSINGTAYMTETTENVLTRVIPARERYSLNRDNTKPSQDALELLATASLKLGFSAKVVTRILKVSRAIADLDSEEIIKAHHISEAVQYRMA